MNTSSCLAYALETSGTAGSVALVADERVLAERPFAKGLRHGTDLVPALDAVVRLASVNRRSVHLVVVGTGPGSYTGLRVGLASAKALAFALGVPLVGVPSSDAAVYNLAPESSRHAAVVVDAKRDYVYLSLYVAHGDDWKPDGDRRILPPREAAKCIPPGSSIIGDGAVRYHEVFAAAGHVILDKVSAVPAAGCLGILGIRKFRSSGIDELLIVEPLYLRLSEAEERRLARKTPGGQSTT